MSGQPLLRRRLGGKSTMRKGSFILEQQDVSSQDPIFET